VRLDEALARYNATLPRLQEFILPAGTRSAAIAHVGRTVARRAERALVALGANEPVRAEARQYLNRLSDLLFVLARVLARAEGQGEVLWNHERRHR
jgi:cob(I)alamin adenosyltransferase